MAISIDAVALRCVMFGEGGAGKLLTSSRHVLCRNVLRLLLWLAIMGLFNAAALLPVVLAMHYTGYESLSVLTPEIFFLISVKGLFDNVISDMMWARAIMLTSPTIATVGTHA